MYYQTFYKSPVGNMVIVCDEEQKYITGLWIEGQKYYQDTLTEEPVTKEDIPVLQKAEDWLDAYFEGKKPKISALLLKPAGSGFRQIVWEILCRIPYGSVITYGEIAKEMASKTGKKTMSAQAVGGAVAHNPISVIIPCHRVVGSNGSLTGYAGGIDKKIKLLEHEGVNTSVYFIPNSKRN